MDSIPPLRLAKGLAKVLALGLVVWLVVFGLDWAGYSNAVRIIGASMMTVFVVYQLYEYAMGNLEEARRHHDELK